MNYQEDYYSVSTRMGSFWRQNLSSEGTRTAEKLTHVPWQSTALAQLQESADALLSASSVRRYDTSVAFTDADVIWLSEAIQQRNGQARPAESIADGHSLLSPDDEQFLQQNGFLDFPVSGSITVDNSTYQPRYIVRVGTERHILSIRLSSGVVLQQSFDFDSGYGYLILKVHPYILFGGPIISIASENVRVPNILDFSLAVNEVYGAVDFIMHFYRKSQTPVSLMRAGAQAAGLAVASQEFTVFHVAPGMDGGFTYFSEEGYRLDAYYPHTPAPEGTVVPKGTVMGGVMGYIASNPVPDYITELPMDSLLPVKGLVATRGLVRAFSNGTKFSPALSGDPDSLVAYWDFLKAMEVTLTKKVNLMGRKAVLTLNGKAIMLSGYGLMIEGKPLPGVYWDGVDPSTAFIDPMQFYFDFLTAQKLVIIRIDKDLPVTVKERAKEFLERETLAGSVLVVIEN